MNRWALGHFVLALTACQQPAALGTGCTRASDCSVPLVCMLRACRVACRSSIDCPAATRCIATPDGNACSLDIENHCDTQVCPSPLTCVADQCRTRCATANDCVSGACVGGSCEEPISGTDGGPSSLDASAIDSAQSLVDSSATDAGTDAPAEDSASDAGCVPASCAYRRCTTSGVCDDVVALALGADHLCLVRAGGTVVCDGNDDAGQLGDHSTAKPWMPVVAHVDASDIAVDVAAADNSTCVLLADGHVRCWGTAGGLGTGSTTSSPDPVSPTIGSCSSIAAGGSTTCAIDEVGGAVHCWGSDNANQCGDTPPSPPTPTPPSTQLSPVDTMPAFTDARRIAVGANHTCVTRMSTTQIVQCWGRCDRGQCGNVPVTTGGIAYTPQTVIGFTSPVVHLALGGAHTCAVMRDGDVRCMGASGRGQLGDGQTTNDRPAPNPVAGLTDASDLCAGVAHTCVLRRTGDVVCWGDGAHGALGDGTTAVRATPGPVPGIDHVTRLTCGAQATCALRMDGSVWCWGLNQWDNLMSTGAAMMPQHDELVPTRIDSLP